MVKNKLVEFSFLFIKFLYRYPVWIFSIGGVRIVKLRDVLLIDCYDHVCDLIKFYPANDRQQGRG